LANLPIYILNITIAKNRNDVRRLWRTRTIQDGIRLLFIMESDVRNWEKEHWRLRSGTTLGTRRMISSARLSWNWQYVS